MHQENMLFALTKEISEDIGSKSAGIQKYSDSLKEFYSKKEYGTGVKTILIGVIAVHPGYDFFFKVRKCRLNHSEKRITYDIKLEFEKVKKADELDIFKLLTSEILKSFSELENRKFKNFDFGRFKSDFLSFTDKMLVQ